MIGISHFKEHVTNMSTRGQRYFFLLIYYPNVNLKIAHKKICFFNQHFFYKIKNTNLKYDTHSHLQS